MKRTNLRPWSQGDDNGLCGLFATINPVRWLWPELRHKDDDGEERVAALALHLVRDRLNAAQFKALYLDGDELPMLSKLVDFSLQQGPPSRPQVRWPTYPCADPRSSRFCASR